MNTETRPSIALIAASLANGKKYSSVYDYDQGKYISYSGEANDSKVNVYDYTAACHITGKPSSLYHYKNAAHMSIKMSGNKFSGFDYKTSSHFSGTVNNKSISLYDYDGGSYHNYSVS